MKEALCLTLKVTVIQLIFFCIVVTGISLAGYFHLRKKIEPTMKKITAFQTLFNEIWKIISDLEGAVNKK